MSIAIVETFSQLPGLFLRVGASSCFGSSAPQRATAGAGFTLLDVLAEDPKLLLFLGRT